MLEENHVLDILTEEDKDIFEFEGMGLGRATGEEIGQDTNGEGVEIYRTTDESLSSMYITVTRKVNWRKLTTSKSMT